MIMKTLKRRYGKQAIVGSTGEHCPWPIPIIGYRSLAHQRLPQTGPWLAPIQRTPSYLANGGHTWWNHGIAGDGHGHPRPSMVRFSNTCCSIRFTKPLKYEKSIVSSQIDWRNFASLSRSFSFLWRHQPLPFSQPCT